MSEWRTAWTAAASKAVPDRAEAGALRRRLDALELADDDMEIEREMLEALDRVADLAAAIDQTGLPLIATGHRVVGTEPCHFTAPASMPDDPSQPSGRLLLTSARAIFLGGVRGTTVSWHAVAEATHAGRDIVLIRTDGEALWRFRCNSFTDALCAAYLARRLAGALRSRST